MSTDGPAAGQPIPSYPESSGGDGRDSSGSSTVKWVAIIGIPLVLILILIGVGVALSSDGDDEAGDSEIFLEPAASSGIDPYTESVDDPDNPPAEPATSEVPSDGGSNGPAGISTASGGQPGLYGGTRNNSSCDKAKLTEFLLANPSKAAAWAGVQGIPVDQIAAYIEGLTPILLTSDTRVTNHGYKNGRATVINAVLQKGTAVLVDDYGRPVVRCACGNPLAPPRQVTQPKYHGQQWNGWNTTNVIVVQQTTIQINIYILVDVETGERFGRRAGTDGRDDTDDPGTTTTTAQQSTTTTTTRAPTSPVAPPPPPTPLPPPPPPAPLYTANDAISAWESVRSGTCGSVDFPFPRHNSEDISANALNADGTVWGLTVIGHTDQGTSEFSWTVELPSGNLTPTNPLAQEAARYCPALG
jgi:hypothetical protein